MFLPEVNTDMMNIYFEELLKEYPGRDILIIMDQAGWHKAKELKVPESITLMFLAPYSPELNKNHNPPVLLVGPSCAKQVA